jgi:hypothetical protein
MDRATIERNLAQVERDMRAASEDIAHPRQTSRNLVRHGQDTMEAVRSIGILECESACNKDPDFGVIGKRDPGT